MSPYRGSDEERECLSPPSTRIDLLIAWVMINRNLIAVMSAVVSLPVAVAMPKQAWCIFVVLTMLFTMGLAFGVVADITLMSIDREDK